MTIGTTEPSVSNAAFTSPSWKAIATWSAIIFVLAFAHGAIRMGRPFVSDKEGTACGLVMMPPINYLRYGPFAQRLGGIINAGEVERANLTAYVHHPPGVTITSALAHAALGRADWVARLVPTLFTALTAALLFAALAREGRTRAGALAAALFIVMPITVMYGGMPDYVNFQVAFLSSLSLWLWLESVRLTETSSTRLRVASLAVFTLACLSDWPGFYVVPVIWIGAWLVRRRFDAFAHVVFPVVGVALLASLAGWLVWAGSDVNLLDRFLLRASGELDRGEGAIGIGRWFTGVTAMMSELHTPIALACTVIYGIASVAAFVRARDAAVRYSPIVLLMVGVLLVHFFVARQGSFQHEWWHVMFTPAIAACVGVSLHAGLRLIERRVRVRHAGHAVAAVVVVALAAWSSSIDAQRRHDFGDAGGYTLRELGLLINRVAAPGEGVLTSDSSDWLNGYSQSALGWYADRQMRPCIVDVSSVLTSLEAGPYPLFLGYQQRSGPAPRWFVMPSAHRASRTELAAFLDARYQGYVEGKFHVYDLAAPR